MNEHNTLFDQEIQRRLDDDLWSQRISKSVMQRVKTEKHRRLGVAAGLVFAIGLSMAGYFSLNQPQESIASIEVNSEAEITSQAYLEWFGFSRFPLQEDEELSIVMNAGYFE